MTGYLLLLCNMMLLITGQILWKIGVKNIDQWNITTINILMKSPYILGGCFLYVIATALWLYILSKMPFSIAYPFQSLNYVLGVLLAYLLFKETIGLTQWLGTLVIVFGVYLIAK